MKYAGIKFKKIEAERFETASSGNITVNSNFNIKSVKREEELTKDPKKPLFGFEFTYALEYDDIAKISFNGVLYLEIEDKKQIEEFEQPDFKLSDNMVRKFILDLVLMKTHVESLHLEEKLNLPFHIQSPKVAFGEKPAE